MPHLAPTPWTGCHDPEDSAAPERLARWHHRVQPWHPQAQGGMVLIGFAVDEGVRRNQGRTTQARTNRLAQHRPPRPDSATPHTARGIAPRSTDCISSSRRRPSCAPPLEFFRRRKPGPEAPAVDNFKPKRQLQRPALELIARGQSAENRPKTVKTLPQALGVQ